jgi:hypothetical protein
MNVYRKRERERERAGGSQKGDEKGKKKLCKLNLHEERIGGKVRTE